MSFTEEFKQTIMAQESRNVILTLVTLSFDKTDGSTFVGHYVNDYLPVESVNPLDPNGDNVVFQTAAFNISLGSETKDSVTQTSLTFDSGDRQFIREIRQSEGSPRVYIQVALSESPLSIEMGPIELMVESYTIKSTVVTVNLTIEPILDEPIPALRYTPNTFPMLWRGKLDES